MGRAWRPTRAAVRVAALAGALVAAGAAAASANFGIGATGGPMTVSTATLTAASGLSASRSCASTTSLGTSLSWTASASSATSGYSILRSTTPSGTFSPVGSVNGIGTTTYTDSISPPAVADSLYVAVKSANGMDVVGIGGSKTANSGGANLKNPTAIAVTPDGTTAYLANSGANTVTPVTLSNDAAGTQITVGTKPPTDLAVTSDGTKVWVADGPGNAVTPITVSTNTAGSSVAIGFNATAIAITPDGTTAWIAGQTKVVSLNLSTLALGTTLSQAGANFQSIAITPDGTTAYLVDASGAKEVWPLTLATGTWGTGIALSFTPQAIAISPGGTTAWVAGQTDIVPVTLASSTVGKVVNVAGANFQGIALAPNGCTVYAADASGNNQIVPVTAATDTEGTPIATDTAPYGLATAYPHATYYYEVEATRNLWTSPATSAVSESFGQPPLSLPPSSPAFTSTASTTFTSGAVGSFTVTTSGYPAPSLSETGSLPAGVSFTDNGDGTATVSGTPSSTGSYPLTLTATNSQGRATQSFALYVYSAAYVVSGSATGGTSVTSASFSLTTGSTYLVLAATHDTAAGANTMSIGVGTAFATDPTFTQIGSQQDYDSNAVHYSAWYLNGGSGSGTVTVSLTNATHQAYVEVIQIGGANTSAPVVTATEGFSNSGTTAGTSATANLSGGPTAGDYELVLVTAAGDAGPPSPTSSSFILVTSSYLHGGGGGGASVAELTGLPSQNATVTLGASVIWGTMSVEIAHP